MEMLDWFEEEHTEIVSRIESTKILSDELHGLLNLRFHTVHDSLNLKQCALSETRLDSLSFPVPPSSK